jgi:cell volume regulation protein A
MYGFIESGSLLLRMTIFILLGTHVDFSVIKEYLLPGCIIVAVFMFIARPLAVLCCTLPDRKAKWSKNEVLFMFWTRETGVIPAALSGMLVGMNIENANIIASITFMAILATLVIQASTTKWLAKRLNLLEE